MITASTGGHLLVKIKRYNNQELEDTFNEQLSSALAYVTGLTPEL